MSGICGTEKGYNMGIIWYRMVYIYNTIGYTMGMVRSCKPHTILKEPGALIISFERFGFQAGFKNA